jgi:hypothetical protein
VADLPGGRNAAGVDDATLAVWAKRGTVYVPTIDHNRFYAENASLFGYTRAQVAALDSFRLLNLETARRAHTAGVRLAMGSDAVYWMFGENTCELGWFVKAGMTPAQAGNTLTIRWSRSSKDTCADAHRAFGHFQETCMERLLIALVSTVASAAGWWLGAHVGIMTAFIASIVGLAVGVWGGRHLANHYLA